MRELVFDMFYVDNHETPTGTLPPPTLSNLLQLQPSPALRIHWFGDGGGRRWVSSGGVLWITDDSQKVHNISVCPNNDQNILVYF